MRRVRDFAGFALACVSFMSAPAVHAANWAATSDPWFWIDLDSRQTRDGVTYFVQAHSAEAGSPPDMSGTYGGVTPEANHGFNCATGQSYFHEITNRDAWLDDETATVQPVYAWVERTADTSAERVAELRRIVCGQ